MKKLIAFPLLFICATTLVSCGFEPMYGKISEKKQGESYDIQSSLERIEIGNIPDRSGQYLRNALIDRFYSHNRPEVTDYTLKIQKILENTTDLDITKTSDTTRAQLRLLTTMTLTDNETGEVVLNRKLSSIGSFNVLGSEFANRVTEDNTRKNALDDLARQIELQIGLYLNTLHTSE